MTSDSNSRTSLARDRITSACAFGCCVCSSAATYALSVPHVLSTLNVSSRNSIGFQSLHISPQLGLLIMHDLFRVDDALRNHRPIHTILARGAGTHFSGSTLQVITKIIRTIVRGIKKKRSTRQIPSTVYTLRSTRLRVPRWLSSFYRFLAIGRDTQTPRASICFLRANV